MQPAQKAYKYAFLLGKYETSKSLSKCVLIVRVPHGSFLNLALYTFRYLKNGWVKCGAEHIIV